MIALPAIWSFISGGFMKLVGSVFAWLKTIPWYVLVIAAMVIAMLIGMRAETKREEALKTQLAAEQRATASYAHANAINFASVNLLIATVQVGNRSIAAFEADAAHSAAAARAFDAKAQNSARDAATARAIIHNAAPLKTDVPAPPAHNQIRGLL